MGLELEGHGSSVRESSPRNNRRVPHTPDFLCSFVGSLKFLRLSLKKGAHAVLSRAAYRKFGASRSFFARCGIPLLSPSSPKGTQLRPTSQTGPDKQLRRGAPCSHQRTWAENEVFRMLSLTEAKAVDGLLGCPVDPRHLLSVGNRTLRLPRKGIKHRHQHKQRPHSRQPHNPQNRNRIFPSARAVIAAIQQDQIAERPNMMRTRLDHSQPNIPRLIINPEKILRHPTIRSSDHNHAGMGKLVHLPIRPRHANIIEPSSGSEIA